MLDRGQCGNRQFGALALRIQDVIEAMRVTGHHIRSGHIALKSQLPQTLADGVAVNSPARTRATRAKMSPRTASSCSFVRVVDRRVADSVKYSVTRSGVPRPSASRQASA